MKPLFLPEATGDIARAIEYYEAIQINLGLDFLIELEKAVARIVEYPKAWQKISDDFHRCLLGRFPYGIIYSIETDCIIIVSVMNLHQHPDTWKSRI
jgi:hypothetical protein